VQGPDIDVESMDAEQQAHFEPELLEMVLAATAEADWRKLSSPATIET